MNSHQTNRGRRNYNYKPKNNFKSQRRNQIRFGNYNSESNDRDQSHENQSNQMSFSEQSETEKQRENQHLQVEKEMPVESIDTGSINSNARKQQKQEELIYSKTISQSQKNQHLAPLSQEFLQEIQNLDYKKLNFYQLQQQFKEIVKGHIVFKGIYPQSQSTLGTSLIINGLFHEMWGNVLLKSKENHSFWVYYQKYQNLLHKNHSNFESMFNQFNSLSSQIQQNPKQSQEETNSTTNLYSKQKKFQRQIFAPSILRTIHQDRIRQDISEEQSVSHRTIEYLNFSSKENLVPAQNIQTEVKQKGRLKNLGFVQTNQRKLNVEIVCFFLNVKKVYRLETVHFSEILQTQLTAQTQIILLEGQVEEYCEPVRKVALNYLPKLLLIAYGDINLATLLRLKNTYGKIQGLVVYDELIDIRKWLRCNNLINQDNFQF